MTTRVLLLRHAESADPSVFHGAESDVGLSDRGRLQAEAVARHLATLAPDALVCSGMRRARETAEAIRKACGLPLEVEPDLHERRVGTLSGTPTGLREGVWPQTLHRWLAGETGHAPPGAESFDAIRARVLPAWERVIRRHAGRTVAVVAHGVVCKVLLVSVVAGLSLADWPALGAIHNVAIHELVREGVEGPWEARRINELPPGADE